MQVNLTYDHYHTFRCRDCKGQFTVNRAVLDPCEVIRCTQCDGTDTQPYQTLFKRVRNFMMMYELA